MEESEEEPMSLLMKVKDKSEKVGLKHNIEKTKIMASSPITSWEIEGETLETVSELDMEQSDQIRSVAQSCLTLCDPMDCSLPGSSVQGILQAKILECVVISSSRRSS